MGKLRFVVWWGESLLWRVEVEVLGDVADVGLKWGGKTHWLHLVLLACYDFYNHIQISKAKRSCVSQVTNFLLFFFLSKNINKPEKIERCKVSSSKILKVQKERLLGTLSKTSYAAHALISYLLYNMIREYTYWTNKILSWLRRESNFEIRHSDLLIASQNWLQFGLTYLNFIQLNKYV
jgi:hypothetical protein